MFAAALRGLQIVRNAFAVVGDPSDVRPCDLALTRILDLVARSRRRVDRRGAALGGAALIAIWIVALVLDYAGPYAGYWTPALGRSETTDWEIESAHFSERFQLFVIIALGESIVVTGVTASGLDIDARRAARRSPSRSSGRRRCGGCTSTTWRAIAQVRLDKRGRPRAGSRATPTPTCTSR